MKKQKLKTYKGFITHLEPNHIFVFGSNPEGMHGAGAARIAVKWGAKYRQGRGLMGQTYGLVTKNLTPGYHEKSTSITYHAAGMRSVSEVQIIRNIADLYDVAKLMGSNEFLVAYTAGGQNLNGYTDEEMAHFFAGAGEIPGNMVFEEGFAKLVERFKF